MGYLPSCFVPTKGHLAAQMSQPLGICSTKVKTMLMPGEGGGGAAYRGSIPFRESSLSRFSLKFLAEALSTQAYLPRLHPQNSKRNFTLKRSLMNRQLIKRIKNY